MLKAVFSLCLFRGILYLSVKMMHPHKDKFYLIHSLIFEEEVSLHRAGAYEPRRNVKLAYPLYVESHFQNVPWLLTYSTVTTQQPAYCYNSHLLGFLTKHTATL